MHITALELFHYNCHRYHRLDLCKKITHSILLLGRLIQVNSDNELLDGRDRKSLAQDCWFDHNCCSAFGSLCGSSNNAIDCIFDLLESLLYAHFRLHIKYV